MPVADRAEWAVTHAPVADTIATITKAAAAAGVAHVCTGITVVFVAGAVAPTAVAVKAVLRDGATGVGTILWSANLALPAVAGEHCIIALSGLRIEGAAATAMCLEFTAAGGANTLESVAMIGEDVNAT